MAARIDRVAELIEGFKRTRHELCTPEGVPLDIQAASRSERLSAFTLDMIFMFAAIICLHMLLLFFFFAHTKVSVGATLILFLAFIVRTMYFLHFELAWQGRTPGKRICGLQVINRSGGELSPSAIIARNLTREVEIFLPLSLLFGPILQTDTWQDMTLFGWIFLIACLPLFNKQHLRAGDLIAGTMVISMPKRVLLQDLADTPTAENVSETLYSFSHEQLALYGNFELQVLEEFLRRQDTPSTNALLEQVCQKICHKIGWEGAPVPAQNTRRFLSEFYAAERASLERGQLLGKVREQKAAPAPKKRKKK